MGKDDDTVMKEIRLGTIGSGFIVQNILDAAARTERIRLEAVYSRSEEKGYALARKNGASKVYTNLDAMLDDPVINTIYVASPNSLHYDHCSQALDHGKHVICEKPFCTHAALVMDLLEKARSKGVFLIDATPTAFLPNYEILKQQLDRIGRIRLVLCSYSQYSSRYDTLKEYLETPGSSGVSLPNVFNPDYAGGCLMDINYYNVYFIVSLFGQPSEAVYYPNLSPAGTDTSGIIVLRYPDFVCQGSGAKDTWGVNSAQIQGEDGYLYVEQGSNGFTGIRLVTREKEEAWNEQTEQMPGETNRWYYEIRNLTRMMLEGDLEKAWRQTETAAEVIRVIENARRTAGIRFPGD